MNKKRLSFGQVINQQPSLISDKSVLGSLVCYIQSLGSQSPGQDLEAEQQHVLKIIQSARASLHNFF